MKHRSLSQQSTPTKQQGSVMCVEKVKLSISRYSQKWEGLYLCKYLDLLEFVIWVAVSGHSDQPHYSQLYTG